MSKFGPICWLMGSSIFLAAMLVYRVDWNPTGTLANTAYESLELGNSIALKGSFSDPFAPLSTGPSAHVAPGYPALVALIIKIFGSGPDGNFALGIVTKIVVAAQLALFPFLAEYLGLGCWPGAIAAAAWLIAAFPLVRWESDFAGLLIVILAFPMYKAFFQELSTAGAVGTGVLWGVIAVVDANACPRTWSVARLPACGVAAFVASIVVPLNGSRSCGVPLAGTKLSRFSQACVSTRQPRARTCGLQ